MGPSGSLQRIGWTGPSLPPAESRVPAPALLAAFLPGARHLCEALRERLCLRHCVPGGSGRALLCLLLRALRAREGAVRNEVLVPAYTCYSVAAAVVRAGLRPRLYDLDPATFLPDPSSVEARLSGRTLAVLGQHLFGIPCPPEPLRDMARQVGAVFIEDAAQALGGGLEGEHLGTLGDFGLFSFGRGKPLPLGTGGVLTGHDGEILGALRMERRGLGWTDLAVAAATQVLSTPFLYGLLEALPLGLGKTVFDPGFPVEALTPFASRMGARALEGLERLNGHRRRIAGVYGGRLDPSWLVPVVPGGSAVFTRFPVRIGPQPIPGDLHRSGVRRMYPRALGEEPAIRVHLEETDRRLPGASEVAERLVTLPTHLRIGEAQAEAIADRLRCTVDR